MRVLTGLPADEGGPGRRLHAGQLLFEPVRNQLWCSKDTHTLRIRLPESVRADSLLLLGVFGLDVDEARAGAVAGGVRLLNGTQLKARWALRIGDHLVDATNRSLRDTSPGDGSAIKTVGCVEIHGEMVRLDLLTFDLPSEATFDRIVIDGVDDATFCVLEAAISPRTPTICPFRAGSGGVSLADLAGIVRVRDRVRF
ncbi:MAG: hypothetical protein C4320_01345, partial [Armatimonadota bacterium]